jgi:hypothetical protein
MNGMCSTVAVLLLAWLFLGPASAETWTPPEPKKEQRDWVMLTSGEWLWGDIQVFRDESLSFDSEKMDEVALDWADVAMIRSARALTYTFTADRIATGTAVMQDSLIRVKTATGVVAYPRTDLLKIIEGGENELDYWSLKASWGLTARTGNTDQSDLNSFVKIRREAERTRFDVNYNGNYSTVKGAQTINNQRVGSLYSIIMTRNFFVSPFLGEFYRDEFQNIHARYTIGAGVGWWIVRRSDLEWIVQVAGAYRDTRYVSVAAGRDLHDRTGALILGTGLEWDITKDMDFDVSYNSQVGVPDLKDTTHHAQALLSIDVFGEHLNLNANLTWDRIESPQANAEGVVPKRDDFRMGLGFGLDL